MTAETAEALERRPVVTVGVTSYQDVQVLGKCLDSLVAQTLPAQQIEVILVDDGSDDGTVDVAEQYRKKASWSRYQVLTQSHTGSPSTGRNRIIEEATGDFVFFADADDYLGLRGLETMMATAQKDDADIVIGRFEGVGRPAPNVMPLKRGSVVDRWDSRLLRTLNVLKLFRRSLLRSIPYRFNPQARYAGDQPFMLDAYLHATHVSAVSDVPCYYAVYHEPSPALRAHLTQQLLPASEQLQFIRDSFSVLAMASSDEQKAEYAGWLRERYWNRLLRVHIPMQILRRTDAQDLSDLLEEVRAIARQYGAAKEHLEREPGYMLRALGNPDARSVAAVAQIVRNGAPSMSSRMKQARHGELEEALSGSEIVRDGRLGGV